MENIKKIGISDFQRNNSLMFDLPTLSIARTNSVLGNTLMHDIHTITSSASSKKCSSVDAMGGYAVQTTVNGSASLKQLLNDLAEKKKIDPSLQIALVSGGSLSGYSTALKLKNLGFYVIVAERRKVYTRQNVLMLREDALYSLANLSPDGTLIRHLVGNKLLDFHKNRITQEEDFSNFNSAVNKRKPAHRFLHWLTNDHSVFSAKIPVRIKKELNSAEYLDLPLFSSKQSEPFQSLDLAWPEHEVVVPTAPRDWQFSNLNKMAPDNLGVTQIKNMEKGMNEYCKNQKNIDIVSAEIDLRKNGSIHFEYSPIFVISEKGDNDFIEAPFHFDLICIAEGANSKNASLVGAHTVIPKVESWCQVNYSGYKNKVGGFSSFIVDKNKKEILATLHTERENSSLFNVSMFVDPNEKAEDSIIKDSLEKSKYPCSLAGVDIEISDDAIEFISPRIDVDLKRTNNAMHSNAIIIGDSAGSGSAVAGLGASLALSAYPEMVERLVKHPEFKNLEKRKEVENFFKKGVAQIVNLRLGDPSDIMRKLGFYSAEINKQRIKDGVAALFSEEKSDKPLKPNHQ